MADRLLVIDDEVELGRFVGRVGESVGYEVKVTCRAREFKDVYVRWNPSVITLDLAMPEMDGIELLRWLAAENCHTPIIIMSGFDERVVESAKRIGLERGLNICAILTKPMRVHDIKGKLELLKEIKSEPIDKAHIERSFAERELFLLYQPKISLKNGSLQGVEALLRWRHPTHGILLPDLFIALAEETGMIDEMTNFVLLTALQQQKSWKRQGLDLNIAVNLSPINLHNARFVENVVDLCAAEDVPPDRITLEIKESTAMHHALETVDVLTRLRLKGFRIAIDDFGSGSSSLSWLQRLPITEIKIDRPFVKDATSSSDALIVVKTVIDLAWNMRITSLAEGIETAEHYQLLADMGCELGQGDAIAKPLTAEELVRWYETCCGSLVAAKF